MISLALIAALLPIPHVEVPATFIRIIDGDTVEVRAHLPFDVHIDLVVRVAGIDCPEMRGLQARAGKKAKEFTQTWSMTYPDIIIQDTGKVSFDRVVSTVCPAGGGKCLDDALRDAGHFKVKENLGR